MTYVPFLKTIDVDRIDDFWDKEYGEANELEVRPMLEALGPMVVPVMRAAKQGKRIVS